MTKTIFAWDLGATNCTAGIVEFNAETAELHCKKHITLPLLNAVSLQDLILQIESALNYAMADADAICIGAAGFYDGSELLHENHYPYLMNFAHIAKTNHWPAFAVIHDYAPIVCATFTSYMQVAQNIKRLNQNPMQERGRRVALGIGTGLGLKDGILFEDGDFWLGQNEIGHIGIPTPPRADKFHRELHKELIHYFQKEDGLHAGDALTFEKVLTGLGMSHLYHFFNPAQQSLKTPQEVAEFMRNGEANEVVEAFAFYVGLLIGTVQLTFMPDGGVWITGGVAIKNLSIFDCPKLFDGIHASPAYRKQRDEYPLGILCNQEHALIGCGYYASKRLLD